MDKEEWKAAVNNALTEAEFRKWLASFPADDLDGYPRDGAGCPIARYLRGQGFDRVFVGETYVHDDGHYTSVMTPEWARRFIGHVDTETTPRVTYGRCLELLDS